jgi:hypothetical protein
MRTINEFVGRVAIGIALSVALLGVETARAASTSDLPDFSPLIPYTTFGNFYNFNLATVNGDIGISSNGTLLAPNGQINGTAFLDTGVTQSIGGPSHITGGIVSPVDLSVPQALVLSASATLQALTPDYTLGNVNTAQNFSAAGPVTVIDMDSLSLGGSNNISFTGSPSSIFVLNIAHGLSLTGSSIIGAGVDPSHILINLYDSSGNLGTAAHINNVLNGSVLIPYDAATFHSMNGAIWSGDGEITLMSGATVTSVPFVPEASTTSLLIFGLLLAAGAGIARRRRALRA